MTEEYVPKHPTRGWMASKLEDLGVRVRGHDLSDAQLARMLRERGFDVSEDPAPRPEQKNDR